MCKVTSQHASRAYQFHQCLSMAEKVCSLSSHAHKLAIWLLTGHLTGQADFSHHCQGSFFPLISDRDLFFLVNNIFVFTHVTHGHCRSYGERKVQRSESKLPIHPGLWIPLAHLGKNNRSPYSSEDAPSASRPPGIECGPRAAHSLKAAWGRRAVLRNSSRPVSAGVWP